MGDRVDYFFRQRVTEAELDLGFELLEQADHDLAAGLGFVGVVANAIVSEHAPVPDLTADVSGPGTILDQLGRRIFFSSLQTVNVANDDSGVSTAVVGAGAEKVVSVFVKFDRLLSDPRVDGLSLTVFFRRDESFRFIVAQGGEAPAGAALPPPLRADAILLADVVRRSGQTQILNGDISTARRQDVFVVDGSPHALRRGRTTDAIADLLELMNLHLDGAGDRHPAGAIDYDGGGAWADGTPNPATDLEAQVDKMIADLAAATGALKVGAAATAGVPSALAAGTVKSQLDALLGSGNAHATQAAGAHPASAIAFAGSGAWADGNLNPATSVEAQLDKVVSDLAAITGALKIGAAVTAGAPNALPAGSVKSQIDGLLGFLNAHLTLALGAHPASAISYAGGGAWADGTANPAATVEAQLDKLVSDLAAVLGASRIGAATTAAVPTSLPAGTVRSQLDALLAAVNARAVAADLASVVTPGAGLVGADAVAGAPDALAAGTVNAQLATLLTLVNARARKAGDTFTGNLLPNVTGLDLGAFGARWDAFLRDVNATASAAGTPAVQATAFNDTTPAIRGSGTAFLLESDAIEASHIDFLGLSPVTVWDLVKGWTFLPQHAGDIPDAFEINGVTQRNLVKAWGSVTTAGVLNDPHWNVSAVTKPGTGRYSITLDVSPGTRNAVVVTVSSAVGSASWSVHVFSPDGIGFEVDISNGGTLADQAFMFVVLGG